MGSRTWIKVYCDKWLEGTISEESINIRGVWISLLALAGNGKYGDSGYIMALDGVGFNNNQLAAMLKISLNQWVAAKNRLIKTGRITEQPPQLAFQNAEQPLKTPLKKTRQLPPVITIVNWKKYQSEYERTSKYRSNATTKDTTKDTVRERDKRIEKENNNKIKKETNKEKGPAFFSNKDTNWLLSSSELNIYEFYEQEIGILTPIIADELREAEKLFPPDWIKDAIREAVKQNKRTWKYIAGILNNWESAGRGRRKNPDHNETMIHGIPVAAAVEIAEGKKPSSKTNLKKFRDELDSRGIKYNKPKEKPP